MKEEKKENYERSPINGMEEIWEDYKEVKKEELSVEDIENIIDKRIKRTKPKIGLLRSLFLIILGFIIAIIYLEYAPYISNKIGINLPGIGENPIIVQENIEISFEEEQSIETVVARKASPSVVGVLSTTERGNLFIYGSEKVQGVGSGVVLTEDGYILTNSHVISDGKAQEVYVLFNDNVEKPANILWYDSMLDLAILKVDHKGLQPIEIGNSEEVEVGDKAIAIGNPLGLDLQSTLTSGYISGLSRSITFENGNTMEDLIQTDAAINSGNSGGALLNAKGQLIGINTAKNAVAEGIGFAIPIDIAKPVIDSIIETGYYETPILGFSGYDYASFKRMNQIEIGPDYGAIVIERLPDTPADKILNNFDIIIEADGKKIENMGSLKKVLLGKEIGEIIDLKVYRDGEEIVFEIELISQNR